MPAVPSVDPLLWSVVSGPSPPRPRSLYLPQSRFVHTCLGPPRPVWSGRSSTPVPVREGVGRPPTPVPASGRAQRPRSDPSRRPAPTHVRRTSRPGVGAVRASFRRGTGRPRRCPSPRPRRPPRPRTGALDDVSKTRTTRSDPEGVTAARPVAVPVGATRFYGEKSTVRRVRPPLPAPRYRCLLGGGGFTAASCCRGVGGLGRSVGVLQLFPFGLCLRLTRRLSSGAARRPSARFRLSRRPPRPPARRRQ